MTMTLTGLHTWADLLLEAFAGAGPADACVVRLAQLPGSPEEVELGLLRLDGRHPTEVLHELLVDGECVALGVACGGWAAPMHDGGARPSAHPDAERILQVVLVGRGGEVVSRVRFPDGTVLTEPPAVGAVLEALHHALGVAPSRASE